jgi:hypothetical protein
MLCAPTYVFSNAQFKSSARFYWADDLTGDNMAEAGVFTMAPDYAATDEAAHATESPFPFPFVSLASSAFSDFLLPYDDDGTCVTSSSLGAAGQFASGILCKQQVRVVKIWTFDMDQTTAPALKVDLWRGASKVFSSTSQLYVIGGTTGRKQGYRFPVLHEGGGEEQYRLSLADGSDVPADWVIEFSDPVFGNRWEEETLNLQVQGRACGEAVSSQHDRRWVFVSNVRANASERAWAHKGDARGASETGAASETAASEASAPPSRKAGVRCKPLDPAFCSVAAPHPAIAHTLAVGVHGRQRARQGRLHRVR